MATTEEVKIYLEHTQQIITIFDIYWAPRDEVLKGIRDLGLTQGIAKELILGLVVYDYVEGPIEDHLHSEFNVWIFGKASPIIESDEIYIKLSDRREGKMLVCLSFHKARRPLNYPFKNLNSQNNYPLRN